MGRGDLLAEGAERRDRPVRMSTPTKYCRTPEELDARLAGARAAGSLVVLTNGTFDLLHVGHVRYLAEARALGDVLVVGLNSDASVRRYKGPGRPVVPEDERAEILAALEAVSWVILFSEATADALITRVRPQVYAKGRDYGEHSLPEGPLLKRLGIRPAFVGDEKTHAASDLIARLRGT